MTSIELRSIFLSLCFFANSLNTNWPGLDLDSNKGLV